MTRNLEPLERAVLEKLLAGDHPVLPALRQQLSSLTVRGREFTGAGFFTELSVVKSSLRASVTSGKIRFGDVKATIAGLQHGAGFLVYVDDGLLTMLEGYSYDEPWPDRVDQFSLEYLEPDREHVLAQLREYHR